MKKKLLFISLVLLFGLVFSGAVSAADVYVNTTGNDATGTGTINNPYLSVSKGVSKVSNGGTVYIADGVYSGANNRGITINKNMTIRGQSEAGTIIDAQKLNRIFTIQTSYTVNMFNLTLRNGNVTNLGGSIENNGNLKLTHCTITNNYGGVSGGAIINNNMASLTVTDCTFNKNSVDFDEGIGGAIVNHNLLTVTGSSFSQNSASCGGAIFTSDYGVSIVNGCIFTGNVAKYSGGAAYIIYGNSTHNNCVFNSNTATEDAGGAISNFGGVLDVVSSLFNGNTADSGGAILTYGSLTVTGSIFTNNVAKQVHEWGSGAGGAICTSSGTINFNAFFNNTADSGNALFASYLPVNAVKNWWGSNDSPAGDICGPVNYSQWIVMQLNGVPNVLLALGTSTLTADFNHVNGGGILTGGHIPDGLDVLFTSDALGSVNPAIVKTLNGIATTTYTAGVTPGDSTVSATLGGTVQTIISIVVPVDLKATDLTYPTNPYTALPYELSVIIQNIGENDSGAFNVCLKDNGEIVSKQRVNGLAHGAQTTLYWTWTPAFGKPGIHTLLIVADCDDEISEPNEINNLLSQDVTAIGRPDLTPTIVQVPINPYTLIKQQVNVTILNQGDAAATNILVELFDGANSLGTKTISNLAIGATHTLNFDWTPAFLATGLHTLQAIIDPLNTIYEHNETNNQKTNTTTAIGRPDLTPTTIQVPINPYTLIKQQVNVTILNQGDAAATNILVELLDGTKSLGTKTISNLAIGATHTLNFDWTPAFGATGPHTLQTIIDPLNTINEHNETNNDITTTTTVTGRPDLTPTTITTPTEPIYTGLPYTIKTTIANIGDAAAQNILVRLYDNNNLIGTQTITNLTIGATTTLNFDWTPTFGTTGLHTLQTIIDPLNTINEHNETNNDITTTTTVTGRPDLTPTTITTPTEPIYTGLPYTIKTTIANIGDAAAQNILVRLYDNNNLIGTQTITNLTIGATTTLNFDWTPTFGTTGLHTLQTIIDPLNTINEHNETNNDITTETTVTTAPDLIPTLNTPLPTTTYLNNKYTLNITITNNGTADATEFSVKLFDNNTQIAKKIINGLPTGTHTTITFTWTPTTTGTHNLKILADGNYQNTESNETNNDITTETTVTTAPDLIPTLNTPLPTTTYLNNKYTLNITITNNGTADATEFSVKLFDNNTQIAKKIINGLPTGTHTTITFTWTPTTTGTHNLKILADGNYQNTESNETNNDITTETTVTTAPDLTPTTITTPTEPIYTGLPYTIKTTIANIGDAAAQNILVRLYDNNNLIGTQTITNLTIGATTTLNFDWTPTFGTTGLHTLQTIIDPLNTINEHNETNNDITTTTTVTGRPDLTPTTITTPTEPIYTGLPYTIKTTIANIGDAAAQNILVRLYDNNNLIGTQTITNLTIGATTTLNFDWTPTFGTTGLHTLQTIIDPLNTINEHNETNNDITTETTVTTAPDLIPTLNTPLPTTTYLNNKYTLNITITNNGTADATEFSVKLFDNNTQIAKKIINGLPTGTHTTITFTWTPTTTGTHNLKILADGNYQNTESNETNNDITTETTVTTAPDLTPTTITTPTEPIYTGLPYTIKTTIANIGDAAAQNILVRLYDNNNLIGTQTITNLTIGATTTLNFDWTPTFGTTGLHTLQTIIDPLNTINEHNETNNDITTTTTVTGRPDLTPTTITTPTEPIYTGLPYTIKTTIANIGDAAAQNILVRLYDNNNLIGTQTITNLTIGATTTLNFDWTPTFGTTGLHTLQTIIDPLNTINEHNETNNDITTETTVTTAPDLIPTLNTPLPTTTYLNNKYTLNITITNNGTADATEFSVKLFDNNTQIAKKIINGLPTGTHTTITFTWTPTTTGTHNLKILADGNYQNTESNETNNDITTETTVTTAPDLTPTTITTPTEPIYTGLPYTIKTTIANIGDAAAQNILVRLYDNNNLIGTQTITNLTIGATTTLNFDWTPTFGTTGLHTLQTIIDPLNTINEHNETNNDITTTTTVTGRPDLTPTTITTPTEPIYTGLPYTIKTTIANIGDAAAQNILVRLYDNNNLIGTQTITNLTIGATTTLNFDWTPTFGTTGLHTLQTIIDPLNTINEHNETNNDITTETTVTTAPDLIPTLNTPLPTTTYLNNKYTLNITITNNGTADATEFSVKLFDNNTQIAKKIINGLPTGTHTTITFTWTPTTTGTHNLKILADGNYQNTESNETNNDITTETTVTTAPDLIPTLNTPLPTTTYLNNKYTLNITITNNGTADATEFSVKLFDNNTQIAKKIINGLPTGTHTTITFTWTPTTTGTHNLKILADGNYQNTESNETNNDITTETTVTTAPDLTPTTITTPTEPIYTGLPYTIKTTIANIGDAAAQNILVRLYDNNNLIGTQTITNLTIGATTTLNFDWTPTFGTTGLHTLQTIIDPLNTINEHNETNNDITTTTTVTGRPDLTPTTITTPTEPIYTGLPYTIKTTIANIGDAAAQNILVRLYDNNNLIGTQTITNLTIGATTTLNFDWTPTFGTTGLHTLQTIIDPLNTINEHNETNNDITTETTVTTAPDLIPTLNTPLPTTTYLNNKYTLNITITNNGTADATEFSVKLFDNNTQIAKKIINGLPTGTHTTITFTWTPTTTGTHNLKILADGNYQNTESNETNNDITTETTVTTAPDLIPTLNTPLPTTTYLNNKYTLNITITNNGTADATEFSVKLFDNNTQIAKKIINGLPTGTHTTITFTWTPTTTGTHNLKILADGNYQNTESNETNNDITTETTVTTAPDLPDLIPTLNTPLPTTTYLNNKYTLNITITNNGTADATEFSVKLFDNNTQIAKKIINGLPTGTHTTITFTWTPTTTGTHNLKILADGNYQNTESNETNNDITTKTDVINLDT